MSSPATPVALCQQSDVEALLSVLGWQNRVDDAGNGVITGTEIGYLTQAINWASVKVLFYTWTRYYVADLQTSWFINDAAAVLSCYYLATRRGNPVPASIMDLYKDVIEDLKKVKTGEMEIPLIPTGPESMPAWSNVRVDVMRNYRRVRVERGISQSTPTPYRQILDNFWGP